MPFAQAYRSSSDAPKSWPSCSLQSVGGSPPESRSSRLLLVPLEARSCTASATSRRTFLDFPRFRERTFLDSGNVMRVTEPRFEALPNGALHSFHDILEAIAAR